MRWEKWQAGKLGWERAIPSSETAPLSHDTCKKEHSVTYWCLMCEWIKVIGKCLSGEADSSVWVSRTTFVHQNSTYWLLKTWMQYTDMWILEWDIFTFECCILLHIYLTGSLWHRQSQQSFNTLTPFNFLFYSLHVWAQRAILKWYRQLVIISVFWRTILIQRIRCTYAIWYRDVICCHRYFNL
jgi:hypothetical protein